MPVKSYTCLLIPVIIITILLIGCDDAFVRKDFQTIGKLHRDEISLKIQTDAQLILIIEENLNRINQRAEVYFAPFKNEKPVILTGPQRQEIKEIWIQYLEQIFSLSKIVLEYQDYQETDDHYTNDAFLVGYSAYLLLYSTGLYIIENTAFISPFEILLDEPMPEYNSPANLYSEFKHHILKLNDLYDINEGYKIFNDIKQKHNNDRSVCDFCQLFPIIESNYAESVAILNSKRMSIVIANYIDIIKDRSLKMVFPIQKGIALFMAHTRFTTRTDGFISNRQCRQFIRVAEPGDIILERGEWRMTNLGIPGFWPHSALYLGNYKELEQWSDDSTITDFYRKKDPDCLSFTHYLERRYPDAYKAYMDGDEDDDNRIIEGLKEGIIFHSVIGSVGEADHAACLRPRLSKLDKALAIETAFGYWGRGYDYSFSLLSDDKLVCSELIYKSYEPANDKNGLKFNLSEIAGIITLPANNIAAQFDRAFGTDKAQLDLIIYYSCDVRRGRSRIANVDTFRESHKRPRWSFYIFNK